MAKYYGIYGPDTHIVSDEPWNKVNAKYVSGNSGVMAKGFSNKEDAQKFADNGPGEQKAKEGVYYAIYDGTEKNSKGMVIQEAWDKVQPLTKGKKYHKFDNEVDAEYFAKHGTIKANDEFNEKVRNLPDGEVLAFTDGSFKNNRAGYGAVIFADKDVDKRVQLYGPVDNEDYKESRNETGEFQAAAAAIQWAIKHGKNKITIYHDLELVDDKNGTRATVKPVTKKYYDWMKNAHEKIDIKFNKVSGHTGIEYNEEVDKLAKKGADGEKSN